MDSFVYDIEHTILIEEMNASIWPYIYICLPHLFHVTNLPFGIHPTSWQLSPGNSKYIPVPLPEISFTFIITFIITFYFILLLLLDSFCERILVVASIEWGS